jgi:hypothetical protein
MKMRKILVFSALVATTLISCDVLNEAAGTILEPTTTAPSLTNGEVISGLKEALNVGIKNSVNLTSVTDGFLGNAAIRLPFPPDAIKVKEKAIEWGFSLMLLQT